MAYLYRPVFRPPGYATLPPGVGWDYVEVPPSLLHYRPDLPVSRYTYGIIKTDRPLTEKERDTYQLLTHNRKG
jgi:hypothetical protein